MEITLINDWWTSTDLLLTGYSVETQEPTLKAIHNARKVYQYFHELGWSDNAIMGMLGCFTAESTMNPGLIEDTHRSELPNGGHELSDVPNEVMVNFFAPTKHRAIGIAQWDGHSTSTGVAQQKLVGFCMRYGYNWYDGDAQCFRIRREYETNIQWEIKRVGGREWTWEDFIHSENTPEQLSLVWTYCYEVSQSTRYREKNARWWYDHIYLLKGGLPKWLLFKFKKRRVIKRVESGYTGWL